MSSDSEDSEYGPLEATWGTQTPATTPNNDNDDQPKGWDSLLDPTVKLKGDLGDGQLHRKGKNFKPINEDYILAQRLNKPVPKKKMQAAIRETESKLELPISKEKLSTSSRNKKKTSFAPSSTFTDSTSRKFSTSSRMSFTNNHKPQHVEVPSTTRAPLASSGGDGSSWLKSSLVETPFWKQKKDNNTSIAPPTPPSSSSFITNNNTNKQPITTSYTNNRPPPAASAAKKELPAKPKVDNAWAANDESWSSVSKDVEPFTNTGWGNETTTSTNSGWGEQTNASTNSADSGWGEVDKVSSGSGKQKTTSFGWGATETSNSEWGTKETSSSGWGATEATDSGWGATEANDSGWREQEKPKAATNGSTASGGGGWGQVEEEKKTSSTTNGWGSVNTTAADDGGWGSAPSTTKNNTRINSTSNAIPSSRPSWLNTIPSQDNYNAQSPPPSQSATNGSRFSDRSRTRYSENASTSIPMPVNYRPDQVTPIPVNTAPPPPPDNSILITINVELSETHKVSVDIRELADPLELAREFGRNNNIQAENVINALNKLFTTQKDLALKKKQQKLQRRVFANPSPSNSCHQQQYHSSYQKQPRSKYHDNNNVYTKSPYQQTPLSPTTPFTRKQYY